MIANTKPEYNLFNYSLVIITDNTYRHWDSERIHQHNFEQTSNRKRYNLSSMSCMPDYVTLESYYNCPNNICLDTIKLFDKRSLNQYYTNDRYVNMSDIEFENEFYCIDDTGPLAIVLRRIVE